jgi:UDP-N-acetylmuramoyl-L-alanyl-D-glutamate--2,6-diaminopimelate ligase
MMRTMIDEQSAAPGPTSVRDLVDRLGIPASIVSDVRSATVDDVWIDSRSVSPGSLFACVPGRSADGHDFAPDAVERGAAALLVERRLDLDIPQIVVESVRRALGPVAAEVHRHPSALMTTIGVTGTNGKTTVSRMIGAMLTSAGHVVEVIGTLDGALTTPEATDLQRRLRRAHDQGARHAVMEVSSHGLVEHRVDGVHFDVAVFTNLGRDHLDLHGTQEEYFRAKASLFTRLAPRRSVINVDDTHGRLLADALAPDAVDAVSPGSVEVVEAGTDGSTLRLDGRVVRVPLPGQVNIANAVIAWQVARTLGVDPAAAAAGLAAMAPVPGRLERVHDPESGREVLIDFAHTPDALERLIADCRQMAPGRHLVLVVGCGGDRDAAKRPEMGAVAASADEVIVTSDNPRSEDPASIIAAIVAGIPAAARDRCRAIVDRREAIAAAIAGSSTADLVVVAGRGHETVQEVMGERRPFSDRAVVREALGVVP